MTTRRYLDENRIEHTEFESEDYRRDSALAEQERLTPAPSCLKCSHFKVCFLYRNELGMLQSQYGGYGGIKEKDWPNKPEDRAKICHYYINQEDEELR